jgi:capsular polysaccharide biosynthesis protein
VQFPRALPRRAVLCHSGVYHFECFLAEIHAKEIIMPNASISRAHILLHLRKREKSEELLNLLILILSLQQVSFITSFNKFQ